MILSLVLCLQLAVAAAIVPGGAGGAWGGWGANAGGWGANTGVAWAPAGAGAPNAAANPWIPPWISSAPWYPQWGPCTAIGSSCLDCNTKMVCTKIGGMQKACADPTLPHCNLGECSATPSAECAPAVPSTTV